MTYLPLEDLAQVSYVCKCTPHWLSYDMVLSRICRGSDKQANRIKLLFNLAKSGKIWLPSPNRMLKVALRKTCESGTMQYYATEGLEDAKSIFTSITTKGQTVDVPNQIEKRRYCRSYDVDFRAEFGGLFCWDCSKAAHTEKLSKDHWKIPQLAMLVPATNCKPTAS
ncbi:hypothetical protein HDU97_002447 [Phlyctochytrium planicorne]|nr:hypothetical protein HDU97_002447 [Phlyctochytrium planicorne]